MTKTYIDELVEEIATLRDYYAKAITREREMATKFNNAYWENQQLKELLKECYKMLAQYHVENSEPSLDENIQLLTKIDEVLR